MARRRRGRANPHPLELAGGLTLLWVGSFALLVVLPWTASRTAPPLSSLATAELVVLGTAAVAAWVWAIRSTRAQLARGKRLEELQALTPSGFESWVGARFRERGYRVTLTGTHGTGGDHGIDLVAEKPGETAVVQAKKFVTKSVGEPVLRDLYGAMTAAGATKAYLVTTGRITNEARAWAAGKPIELWDAETVARISLAGTPQDATQADATVTPLTSAPATTSTATAAACPRCGAALVERRNKRSGDAFLGCSRFPTCRHTQPVAVAAVGVAS